MKRTLAATTASILAIGLAVIGMSAPANAAGSGDPTPYTVTASSLTLSSPDVFSAGLHNDGNVQYIPASQYVAGESYTHHSSSWTIVNINFHIEQNAGHGAAMVGRSTLPFDPSASDGAFKSSLPTTGYCIVWVQVDGYNQHFGEGGQAPICWTAPDTNNPVTIAPTSVAPTSHAPTCVTAPTWAYTFSGATASGTITASKAGVAAGTPLCAPLYVRSATWNYILPTDGGNPSFPQSLDHAQDIVVNSVGVPVSFAAPDVTGTCQQHDIYATLSSDGFSALALPTTLSGSHNPYEPAFLHETLSGMGASPSLVAGPNPTYSSNPSADCVAIIPTAEPAAVTFQDLCGTQNDLVTIPTPSANDHYSYAKTTDTRDATTGAGDVTVVATATPGFSFSGGKATESWSHTFLSDTANNCVGIDGDPTVTNPVCSSDGTSVVSGFITVFGSTGVTYTIHTLADGESTANDVSVAHGDTNLPTGSYLVTASSLPGYTLTTATTQFPLDIAAAPVDCGGQLTTHALLDPAVTGFGPVCTAGTTTSGYLQIDPADGVNYFIGTSQLTEAKTPVAPGTYVVRAEAADPVNDALNTRDPNPISVTIAGLSTPCSQLATLAIGDGSLSNSSGSLAFTGGAGPSVILIASAIALLLGGVLIATRSTRRSRHSSK